MRSFYEVVAVVFRRFCFEEVLRLDFLHSWFVIRRKQRIRGCNGFKDVDIGDREKSSSFQNESMQVMESSEWKGSLDSWKENWFRKQIQTAIEKGSHSAGHTRPQVTSGLCPSLWARCFGRQWIIEPLFRGAFLAKVDITWLFLTSGQLDAIFLYVLRSPTCHCQLTIGHLLTCPFATAYMPLATAYLPPTYHHPLTTTHLQPPTYHHPLTTNHWPPTTD